MDTATPTRTVGFVVETRATEASSSLDNARDNEAGGVEQNKGRTA